MSSDKGKEKNVNNDKIDPAERLDEELEAAVAADIADEQDTSEGDTVEETSAEDSEVAPEEGKSEEDEGGEETVAEETEAEPEGEEAPVEESGAEVVAEDTEAESEEEKPAADESDEDTSAEDRADEPAEEKPAEDEKDEETAPEKSADVPKKNKSAKGGSVGAGVRKKGETASKKKKSAKDEKDESIVRKKRAEKAGKKKSAEGEDGKKPVRKKKEATTEKKKDAPKRSAKQSAPKKKAAPPGDEAAIARRSIKHTRTGGIPDEDQPRRRRRIPADADGQEGERQVKKPAKKSARKAPSAADIREARQREKNKKRIKTAAALLIVALFAVSAYLTRGDWVPKLESVLNRPKETIVNDGEVKKGNFPLTFSEGAVSSIGSTGSYLLCLDKNQLKFYNEDGEDSGSFSHNYADPVMKSSDKRVLIYDKGGSSLMVVGRNSEMFSKSVKNKLIMAELADNNNVAVVTDDERYAGILTVYDGNGMEIFKWSSSASLLSVTFDKTGDGCFVTTYSGKGGTLSSVVRYFTFDSDEAKMTSESLPVLALQAMQNDNNDFWVAGDTAFYRLDDNGRVMNRYEYMGTLEDFDLSRSCAALVFKGIERRSAELMIFDSNSDGDEPDRTKKMKDGSPKRLKICNGKIVLLKDKVIDCYDVGGNLTATADCSSDYSDFVYFGDNVYFRDFREVNKISFTT